MNKGILIGAGVLVVGGAGAYYVHSKGGIKNVLKKKSGGNNSGSQTTPVTVIRRYQQGTNNGYRLTFNIKADRAKVRQVQTKLMVKADGIWGPITEGAFQQQAQRDGLPKQVTPQVLESWLRGVSSSTAIVASGVTTSATGTNVIQVRQVASFIRKELQSMWADSTDIDDQLRGKSDAFLKAVINYYNQTYGTAKGGLVRELKTTKGYLYNTSFKSTVNRMVRFSGLGSMDSGNLGKTATGKHFLKSDSKLLRVKQKCVITLPDGKQILVNKDTNIGFEVGRKKGLSAFKLLQGIPALVPSEYVEYV